MSQATAGFGNISTFANTIIGQTFNWYTSKNHQFSSLAYKNMNEGGDSTLKMGG